MRYRKTVIGVDFTEPSLAAARWAALEFAPDAEVVLVHALPELVAPSYLQPYLPSPVELTAALAPVFHGALRGLASMLGAARTDVHLATGHPADALATAATSLGADLLCVGRGSRRRGSARFGATTAVRLLSRTRIPTLIVPTGAHEAPTRILTTLDARAGAEDVVATASRLAGAYEARLDVLHVLDDELQMLAASTHDAEGTPVPDDHAGDGSSGASSWRDDGGLGTTRLRALAGEWVEGVLRRTGAAASRATAVIRLGDVGQQVVAHAGEHDVGLIVIGRGGDARHADGVSGANPVGSTTRLVAWATPCPVLVLPTTDRRADAPHRASEAIARAARAHGDAMGRSCPPPASPTTRRSDAWRPDPVVRGRPR